MCTSYSTLQQKKRTETTCFYREMILLELSIGVAPAKEMWFRVEPWNIPWPHVRRYLVISCNNVQRYPKKTHDMT